MMMMKMKMMKIMIRMMMRMVMRMMMRRMMIEDNQSFMKSNVKQTFALDTLLRPLSLQL